MADLLGATNPVPGYDNSITNRNISVLPNSAQNNPQIQNVPDPNRVIGPDRRTEQQDSASQNGAGQIRYDSNFQSFLQNLQSTPNLVMTLSRLFMTSQGTVVLSGLSEGMAQEMSQALEMLQLDAPELLKFVEAQFKSSSRFNGALFSLLRSAYAKSGSEGVRTDILNFLKSYADYSSTSHLESNMLRNLRAMARAMPSSWGEKILNMANSLESGILAGDRKGNLSLIQQKVFPFMSRYVSQTHDLGTPRSILTLLALDVARYENGSEEKLLENFHQLTSYGTLKNQLGALDDKSLLTLLSKNQFPQEFSFRDLIPELSQPAMEAKEQPFAYEDFEDFESGETVVPDKQEFSSEKATAATKFADHLAAAAGRALRGEGSAEVQEIFKQVVKAMLVNESVYMPVNHIMIPLQMDGRMLFSELWMDPNVEEQEKTEERNGGGNEDNRRTMRFLFKMDVQSLGLFDVVLTSRDMSVDIRVACPAKVAPFAEQIETSLSQILTRNGLTPTGVSVRKMERPVALTEVFPKIYEGMNSVNVKA